MENNSVNDIESNKIDVNMINEFKNNEIESKIDENEVNNNEIDINNDNESKDDDINVNRSEIDINKSGNESKNDEIEINKSENEYNSDENGNNEIDKMVTCQKFDSSWLEGNDEDLSELYTEESYLKNEILYEPVLDAHCNISTIYETTSEYKSDYQLDSTHPIDDGLNKKGEVLTPSLKHKISIKTARLKEKLFLERQKERLDKAIQKKEVNDIKKEVSKSKIPRSIQSKNRPTSAPKSHVISNPAIEKRKLSLHAKDPKEPKDPRDIQNLTKPKKTPIKTPIKSVKSPVSDSPRGDLKGFLYPTKKTDKTVLPCYKTPQKPSNSILITNAINHNCLAGYHLKKENVFIILFNRKK